MTSRLVGVEQTVFLGKPAFDVAGANLKHRQTGTNSQCPHGQEQLRIVSILVVFNAVVGNELIDW